MNQANTRDGSAIPLLIAASEPISTSNPLAPPGVRQHERRQQDEHEDRDDQRPCAGIDLACHTPLGGFDVTLEVVELLLVRAMPRSQRTPAAGAAGAGTPTPGMPSPTPVRGFWPAACASPARVRRCSSNPASAIRWCGAAPVTVVTTMSPGRI